MIREGKAPWRVWQQNPNMSGLVPVDVPDLCYLQCWLWRPRLLQVLPGYEQAEVSLGCGASPPCPCLHIDRLSLCETLFPDMLCNARLQICLSTSLQQGGETSKPNLTLKVDLLLQLLQIFFCLSWFFVLRKLLLRGCFSRKCSQD